MKRYEIHRDDIWDDPALGYRTQKCLRLDELDEPDENVLDPCDAYLSISETKCQKVRWVRRKPPVRRKKVKAAR
jgi:hypothetical protein